MGVRPDQYGRVFEKAIRAGKSLEEAHQIAAEQAGALPETAKKLAENGVGGGLKKLYYPTQPDSGEFKGKAPPEVIAEYNRLRQSGGRVIDGDTKESLQFKTDWQKKREKLYQRTKTEEPSPEPLKTVRTSAIENRLRDAGLTEKEIARLRRR
jgi:hypothetical protein